MAKITQYSRISHHTLAGSASATFSVPTSEDFTDGSWTPVDLALSEIGVNEDAGSAYIRIGSDIKQFQLAGVTASAEPLSTTLAVGNTTGGNDIVVSLDDLIKGGGSASISLGTTAIPNEVNISVEDGAGNTATETITPTQTQINIIDGFDVNYYTQLTYDAFSINLYATNPGAGGYSLVIDPNQDGRLQATNGTNTSLLSTIPTQVVLSSTDGTYSSVVDMTTTYANISHTDGTDSSIIDMNQSQLSLLNDNISTGKIAQITLDPTYAGSVDGSFILASDGLGTQSIIRFNENGIASETTNGIDTSTLNLTPTITTIETTDTTNTITDIISIDPSNAGNGTGILSENQVSLDNVYVSVNSSSMAGRLFVDEVSTGVQSSVIVDNLQAKIQSTDGGSSTQAITADSNGKQINLSTQTWNSIGNGKITMSSNGIISNVISFERTSTTNNTITTIHTFQCVNSGPKSYKVRVTGVKDDLTKAYLSEMFGLYLFDGTTVTLVGTLDKVEKTNFSTATSTISISGTTIRVRVTGEATTNIDWEVYVEMNDYQ